MGAVSFVVAKWPLRLGGPPGPFKLGLSSQLPAVHRRGLPRRLWSPLRAWALLWASACGGMSGGAGPFERSQVQVLRHLGGGLSCLVAPMVLDFGRVMNLGLRPGTVAGPPAGSPVVLVQAPVPVTPGASCQWGRVPCWVVPIRKALGGGVA